MTRPWQRRGRRPAGASGKAAAGGKAGRGGRRPRRRAVRVLAVLTLAVAALVLGPVAVVRITTANRIHDDAADVGRTPVAIVLGAGIDGAGRPSPFLSQRIEVAADLYRAGKVRALLMSGDNSRHDYDEVGTMAAAARRLGVPDAAIVTDHAGFDTYSSCYRARSVWGISRAVVVSQPFHLPRAVWLCRRLGVDAQGAATVSSYPGATVQGWIREIPAIDKGALDVLRDREPTFPGPREHTLDAVNAAG